MPRSGPRTHFVSRLPALLWLVTVPVIAVIGFAWLDRPTETFTADVVASSVEPTHPGLVAAEVRWTDEDGVRRVTTVEAASDLVASGTVTMTVDLQVVDPADESGPSATVLMITALIGLAFAVVVLAAERGFGYVRGTGRSGEMNPDDVQESHGFYWRH